MECEYNFSSWYTYKVLIYKVKSCLHASTDTMYKCTDAHERENALRKKKKKKKTTRLFDLYKFDLKRFNVGLSTKRDGRVARDTTRRCAETLFLSVRPSLR